MAAFYSTVPKEFDGCTLANDDYQARDRPRGHKSPDRVNGQSHPSIGKDSEIEEEDGDDDQAHRKDPCYLLCPDALHHQPFVSPYGVHLEDFATHLAFETYYVKRNKMALIYFCYVPSKAIFETCRPRISPVFTTLTLASTWKSH